MMLGPFYYKRKAKEALKGNWQTAMVVAFFSGILLTVGEVFQALYIPIYLYLDGEQVYLTLGQVSREIWFVYGGLMLLALLGTPVLDVGCDHYFTQRLRGTELNVAGLWSRMNVFFRALWLYVQMGVRVILWGLLLVVPGVLAALRYSLAPYFLAEHPDMTASEAIEASKAAMKDQKGSLFSLLLSFLFWMFFSSFVQIALESVSGILATTAGLFIRVWVSAYTNAAVASFYLTASDKERMARAQREMRGIMTEMGVDPAVWTKKEQDTDGRDDDTSDPSQDATEGQEQDAARKDGGGDEE